MNPAQTDFVDILRAERRDILNRMRDTQFTTLKAGYSQTQIISHATYSPWLDDAEFGRIWAAMHAHTLVDKYRCYELYSLAKQLKKLPGAVMEIGVWRGGTAAVLGSVLPNKPLHLFDTFSGVAKADKAFDTLYAGGEHADTDIEMVQTLLAGLGLTAHIHTGIFPDDTGAALPEQVCFAHIDVDTYGSAKSSFLTLWPRVVAHGMVVFDDYGFFGCEGVTQAVDELVAQREDVTFIYNLNGHAVLIKKALP